MKNNAEQFLPQSPKMGIFKSNFLLYKFLIAVTQERYGCKKKSSKNLEDIQNSNLERKAQQKIEVQVPKKSIQKAHYNFKKKIHMQELNQFCHKYLPQHFSSKYMECKLKEHFFKFDNEGSVYELTGKNFALLDRLMAANPGLEGSKIIEKYFIFTIVEFKKYREEIKEITQEKEDKCKTREAVRRILKSMNQKDRMCFLIFMRMAFFYFERKESEKKSKKITKKAEAKHADLYDEIIAFFMDIKFLSMTEDDSFIPAAFMEHCIKIFLDINPTSTFFTFINKMINQCELSQAYKDRINDALEKVKTKQLLASLNKQSKNTPLKKESSSESSILEPKNQNLPPSSSPKQNELTPVKARSTSKSERKTHETSQKKEYIDNKKEQEPNTLNALKKSLQLQKNKSFKERTIYARKTYLMPKKANLLDLTSSAGSNQNNNNQELFLLELNHRPSSRFLDFQKEDDDDYLVGATPKPKKKVKMDKTYTGTFDQNGNFVPGLP